MCNSIILTTNLNKSNWSREMVIWDESLFYVVTPISFDFFYVWQVIVWWLAWLQQQYDALCASHAKSLLIEKLGHYVFVTFVYCNLGQLWVGSS